VSAGTASLLEYRHHLEACYCVEGIGTVTDEHGNVHRIVPGTLYALDQHDRHVLAADPGSDLRLVCVFSPALQGAEVHRWDGAEASCY
jgi:L-ectoine synthase